MKCEDCLFYYREEGEGFSRCHFEGWGRESAPCGEDYWDWDYDPYEYTDDCDDD